MGIALGSNFTVNTALPLDDREVVADTTARDALSALRRYEGLTVYVTADATNYQLQGGITNSDWVDVGGGGILSVADITERDAIPSSQRYEGMIVYMRDVAKTYQLQYGITDFDWTEINVASDGFFIGDTKLTYQVPSADWLALNGQTIYPPTYPTLYPIVGAAEVATTTQTIPATTVSTNAQFGSKGVFFVSPTKVICVRNNSANVVYSATWNPTTRSLGALAVETVTGLTGAAFTNTGSTGALYKAPYLAYMDNVTGNSIVVTKWNNTTGAYVSSSLVSNPLSMWRGASCMALLDSTYYLFLNNFTSGQTSLLSKDGSDVWSAVSGYSLAVPTGYYVYNIPYLFKCATNGTYYISTVITNGTNYQLVVFRNSGSFAFVLHQTLGTAVASANQYGVGRFDDVSDIFIGKIGSSIYKYYFDSGTGNFIQGTAVTLASIGITSASEFFGREAKEHGGGGISYSPSTYTVSSNTEMRTFSLDTASFSFTPLRASAALAGGANFGREVATSPDAYTYFINASGTSSQGNLLVQPARKVLPTLADPATGLKYYVKAQ